jgi:hypothetical protein
MPRATSNREVYGGTLSNLDKVYHGVATIVKNRY